MFNEIATTERRNNLREEVSLSWIRSSSVWAPLPPFPVFIALFWLPNSPTCWPPHVGPLLSLSFRATIINSRLILADPTRKLFSYQLMLPGVLEPVSSQIWARFETLHLFGYFLNFPAAIFNFLSYFPMDSYFMVDSFILMVTLRKLSMTYIMLLR